MNRFNNAKVCQHFLNKSYIYGIGFSFTTFLYFLKFQVVIQIFALFLSKAAKQICVSQSTFLNLGILSIASTENSWWLYL